MQKSLFSFLLTYTNTHYGVDHHHSCSTTPYLGALIPSTQYTSFSFCRIDSMYLNTTRYVLLPIRTHCLEGIAARRKSVQVSVLQGVRTSETPKMYPTFDGFSPLKTVMGRQGLDVQKQNVSISIVSLPRTCST